MIDQHSETWRTVRDWANERIEQNQRMLEQPGLLQDKSEGCRHAIITLRALLKLAEPSKIQHIAQASGMDV